MTTTIHECGGTILSDRNDGQDYAFCDRCHAFAYDDPDELRGAGSDAVPSGCDPVRNRQAWDDGDLHSPEAQWDDVPSGHVRCESGAWSGEGDHCTVHRDAAVRAWYVPDWLRDTARTLLSWDADGPPVRYSMEMAERITVCPYCAGQLAEHDPDWVLVED